MCAKITKREFVKNSAIAACGLTFGLSHMESLAGFFRNHNPLGDQYAFDERFTIESKYYTMTPKGVKCLLCPNFCKLKENETY